MSQWGNLRNVLGSVTVPESEAACLASLRAPEGLHVVSFLNAHGFNLAAKNNDFAEALKGSDTLLRDGSGMKILMKAMGLSPGPNLNGTDLIPKIIDAYSHVDAPIAFMGTQDPWLSGAANIYRQKGANIILTEDGFQDDELYLEKVCAAKPRLVVLGMGMPKQERVSMLLREKLDGPMLVVNGGAVLDFLAGKVNRAPNWMRKTGIEWIYRFLKEPRRLFGRYVIGNFTFLWRTLRLKAGAR